MVSILIHMSWFRSIFIGRKSFWCTKAVFGWVQFTNFPGRVSRLQLTLCYSDGKCSIFRVSWIQLCRPGLMSFMVITLPIYKAEMHFYRCGPCALSWFFSKYSCIFVPGLLTVFFCQILKFLGGTPGKTWHVTVARHDNTMPRQGLIVPCWHDSVILSDVLGPIISGSCRYNSPIR